MNARALLTFAVLTTSTGACATLLSIESDNTSSGGPAGADASAQPDGSQDSPSSLDGAGDVASHNDAPLPVVRHLVVFVSEAIFAIGTPVMNAAGMPVLARPAADATCEAEAISAGLPPTFRAWLSAGPDDAIARLPADADWSKPSAGVTGILVFPSRAHIATGNAPLVPIDRVAGGMVLAPAAGEDRIWTGTRAAGTRTGQDCIAWTAQTGSSATVGKFADINNWTDDGAPTACDAHYHLYCFGY